jgi:ubiquinone/menaquinone biosynthesis C-methylase UbiE
LIEASAEDLPLSDAKFDVVLSLGPLYHLIERETRIRSLRESWRVLRPGGRLFAAAITRYGAVIEGFFKGYAKNPAYAAMMRSVLEDGEHRNPTRTAGLFTTSYFHTPKELLSEVAEAGFVDPELVAVEGPWKCIPDFDQKWQDEEFRSFLIEIIEHMEADASVIGFGGHMMIVATKPVG